MHLGLQPCLTGGKLAKEDFSKLAPKTIVNDELLIVNEGIVEEPIGSIFIIWRWAQNSQELEKNWLDTIKSKFVPIGILDQVSGSRGFCKLVG